MSKNNPAAMNARYEVITQETQDGDLIIPIPEPLLKSMGWQEGDDVEVIVNQDGSLTLKKS